MSGNTRDEATIRALVDDRVKAIRARGIDGSMSNAASDILSFDVVNPLQYVGSDEVGKRLEEWFSSFDGDISFELRDLSITTGADVGFSHSLNHVIGTKTDGVVLDMWWRATVCYQKIDGRWMIVHEHASAPFDVETGQASVDLKP